MERITYRITLDAYKTGIQRTLQGFETADNMSRRISIGLVAGSDTYEIPLDHVTAVMYVFDYGATKPSIHECVIEDNTIIYDVLPITTAGPVCMQVKLIETSLNGAKRVLASPKFVLEVADSMANDDGAEHTATFTALEDALARARDVYDARLLRIEFTEDCIFRAYYADGTVYENEFIHEAVSEYVAFAKSYAVGGSGTRDGEDTDNAKYYKLRSDENRTVSETNKNLSVSYAVGGTGTRAGEDTDNALYFKNVAQSVFESCKAVNEECHAILAEMSETATGIAFSVDFESGHLKYSSQNFVFTIAENGRLQFESISAP